MQKDNSSDLLKHIMRKKTGEAMGIYLRKGLPFGFHVDHDVFASEDPYAIAVIEDGDEVRRYAFSHPFSSQFLVDPHIVRVDPMN